METEKGIEYFSVTGYDNADGKANVAHRNNDEEFHEEKKDGTIMNYDMADKSSAFAYIDKYYDRRFSITVSLDDGNTVVKNAMISARSGPYHTIYPQLC